MRIFDDYFEKKANQLLREFPEYGDELVELFFMLQHLNRKLTPFDKKAFYKSALQELVFADHILPPDVVETLLNSLLDASIEVELFEVSGNYKVMLEELSIMKKNYDF